MFPNMGFWDWVIILAIVLLLFGAKRLPETARSIGRAIASFKKGLKEGEKEISSEDKDGTQR